MAEHADSANDEGLEMLSRLFEEEVPQQEMLERLILPVPSSVEEQLHRHYENVLARNEELESRLTALEQENKTLQEKNDLLRNNLTALYRTSLAEIRFRNLQIASLRKQLQLPVTAAERRISVDTDQSSSISKQSMGRFHGSEDQGNVSGVSRTEIISSESGCSSKGTEKADERRDLTTDTFSSELNLCVSSSSSVDYRANTCSSFSPQLPSSNTTTCSLTDVSLIMSGTDEVSAHTLGVDREVPVSSAAMIPVQLPVSKCYLLKPENQKSQRRKANQNINAFSAVDGSLHLPSCSSVSYSSSEDSTFQGVELEPSLLSCNPVVTSDFITNSFQKTSSSGMMLTADREGKSKVKESSLGDKRNIETKLVNHELLGCTTTTSGTSKSNVKDSKQHTPALTNKEFQSNFAVNVKPKEISLPLAKHKSNQKTAYMKTEVSSEPEFTVRPETKNDRKNLSSTVMPNKTNTARQTKVSLSSSVENFKQTEFRSNPGSEVQDSVNRKTTQKETLVSTTGVAEDKSHCPVEGVRTKEFSSFSTRQDKDFFTEEKEPVESSSHSNFDKIDSAVDKTKPKVEPRISKTGSETVRKCCETSKSETLLDNDLRLKLATKSKADVLHLEGANALCSGLSKSKVKNLGKELETSSERQDLHREAGKADASTTRQGKDFCIEENEPVESYSHSDFQKIDSTIEKTKPNVEPKIFKTGSETIGKHCETSRPENLLDNDLRLKLATKSKADVLHLEGANALCSRLSKSKVKSLEKELETSCERQGLHKDAGKTDTCGPPLLSLHQETSSHSIHHSHQKKSETGDAFVSSQPSKVKTRDDFRKQESGIENDDQRKASRESDNCKRADGPSHKRKLSGSDTELPAKKGRSDESIQERLKKISTMNPSISEQTGFTPDKNSSTVHHEQRKSVTPSSNANKLLKKHDLISRLEPEIEQLKRYMDMAERHDVAQMISQKEGEKHLSRLTVQKKMLDSERLQEAAPVETVLPSTSGSSQKKPLNDCNTPSLTVFTLRSMAKLKQASLSRTHKQVRHRLEKGSSKQDCSVLTVSGEATNNPPEVHNLSTTALAHGNLNSLSLETSLPKLVCSSQNQKLTVNEKLTIMSEGSEVSVVMKNAPQSVEKRFDMNTGETLGIRSSRSKKPTHRKPASSGNVNNMAVQETTSNTPSIQAMEASKTQPSEDVSQNNLLSQRQDVMNETNIKDVGSVFDSGTLCKRNKEVKITVKQLLDCLRMSSKSKTEFGTEQNDEVHAVSQVEQSEDKGSRQQSADGPAETLQSPSNCLQASKSFSKPICSGTPMEVNADLYLGTKVGKDIHTEDSVRNSCSGEEVLSDVDVPVTESNSQNCSFDFLFDVAIAGATPAHVGENTAGDFENENSNFDQDFLADFALEELDNSTGEITEAWHGSSAHTMAENVGSTRSLKQNVKASNSDSDTESDVAADTENAFEDNNKHVETTVMVGNVFSSDPDISSDKKMNLEHQNLQESKKNRIPWILVDNEVCVKNLEISHKLTNWPTADVELLPSSRIQDEDRSPQISPFKLFLHSSDEHCEDGFSTAGEPDSSFSPLRHEALLKETANSSPAKNKASLQSGEMADHATICDVVYSDSELLQVHAPEENFDLYLSDTNDRLFGSVSESPSSFKSPELEDGADGMSKTAEMIAKELSLNNLEFEEGEINDSEKDFPVDFGGRKNYTKSEQTVRDERRMPGRWTKKKSFNGWHSRGHQYGKSRSEKFSRETSRSEVEQIQKNSAGSQMKQKCKARSPHRSHSPEVISNTQSSKKVRLEDEATKHCKERKDRTHSQERENSRYSQEHNKYDNRYEHRQRSRIYHSSETRRYRVAK